MSSRHENYGQEITINQWQIGYQNFVRLIFLAAFFGLAIAVFWFAIFAPSDSWEAVNLYWYSWLYCKIPYGCSENAAYNLQVLHPTIQKLNGLYKDCWSVFCLGTVGSAIVLRNYFIKRGRQLSSEKFIRGAKLLPAADLNNEITKAHPETGFDLLLGRESIRIPDRLTYRHFCFTGASGVGKTQAINSLLRQLEAKKGQKVLIIDLNGQYYARFGQPGDKILSLYDKRSEAWNFWAENAPSEFFAQTLIESSKNDKFFAPAGRALLSDLISLNDSLAGLWLDLTSESKQLLAKLKGGISPALLGAPEQAAGVMATASLQLKFLEHLNYWCDSNEVFSLTDWATSPGEDWVFLIVRDQDLAASRSLLRTWFDLATLGVLQRDENKDYPHLWLIADELPGLGELPTLGKLLSQGRKYKGTAVCGYQTAAQIEHIFGKEAAKEIFQGLQNKIVYRCNDPDTAKHSSRELGDQEIEEVNRGIQFGTNAYSDRNNLNKNIKLRPVVLPSELQNLPDLTAYIKLCHFDPTLIHFDYKPYPANNQATECEVPPKTLKKPDSKPDDKPKEDKTSSGDGERSKSQNKSTPKKSKNNPEPKENNPYDSDPIDPNDFLNF